MSGRTDGGTVVRPRAPWWAWPAAIGVGVACSAVVGLVAATFVDDRFWLTFSVFTAMTLAPTIGLGWLLIVSRYTATPPEHAEESVEARWFQRAQSGAFTDVMLVGGIATLLITVTPVDVDTTFALGGLLVLAMASMLVRYGVLRRREA